MLIGNFTVVLTKNLFFFLNKDTKLYKNLHRAEILKEIDETDGKNKSALGIKYLHPRNFFT